MIFISQANANFFTELFSNPEPQKQTTILVIEDSEDKYTLDRMPSAPMLHHESNIIDQDFLTEHHNEIKIILHSFKSLESNLSGFEEKRLITEIKNMFKEKYLINQVDLIDIKKNLNEVLEYNKKMADANDS